MAKKKKNLGLMLFFILITFAFFIFPVSADFNASSNQSDLNWEVYATTPVNLANTAGYHWINWTWDEGTGRIPPSSWNVSINESWHNDTVNTYYNQSTPHWVNISVWGWNSTDGVLSESAANGQQLINNAPVITNTSDWQGDECCLVYLDFDYTDLDNDTCTFSTNATEGNLNSTTGVFEWQTGAASQGIYFWNFTASDGFGGEDFYVATITVNDLSHPFITDWWNNYTSNNLTQFTIAAEDNRTVFFNVTSNQSGMTWYWYKDGDLVQSGSSDNYNATWDVGGIDKEIRVYGSNPNGNTESLYWIIYIEYTAHEIEWLKLQAMHAQTEAEEMIGQTMLFLILLLIAFAFLLSGYLSPNSTLKIFGAAFSSILFFILAYAIIGNQFGEKLQMAWLAILLGALGIIQAIFTLLLVISLLYMQFTSRRQAGMDNIPFDPGDRNW